VTGVLRVDGRVSRGLAGGGRQRGWRFGREHLPHRGTLAGSGLISADGGMGIYLGGGGGAGALPSMDCMSFPGLVSAYGGGG